MKWFLLPHRKLRFNVDWFRDCRLIDPLSNSFFLDFSLISPFLKEKCSKIDSGDNIPRWRCFPSPLWPPITYSDDSIVSLWSPDSRPAAQRLARYRHLTISRRILRKKMFPVSFTNWSFDLTLFVRTWTYYFYTICFRTILSALITCCTWAKQIFVVMLSQANRFHQKSNQINSSYCYNYKQ